MPYSRRSFIRHASAAVAGSLSLPKAVWSNEQIIGANDKLNVALIGCKNMGWANLSDFLIDKNTRCVALCDVDQGILEARATELLTRQGAKPAVYTDYRKVLDRQDVDIVIIGTPDHWHCLQFVDACKAGKQVYVEKPVGNSIAECEVMVRAAQRYGNIVQVGQQQRSGTLWADMVAYIRSGRLGRIGNVHVWANFNYAALPQRVPDSPVPQGVDFDRWLGPAPERSFNPQRFHGRWRLFWDYGGGLMTDWGVHLLDMAFWAMGVNQVDATVAAHGGNFLFPEGAHETFDTQQVIYGFDGFNITWEHHAGVESGPYGKNYGLLFKGTQGTLVANRENWEVYPETEQLPAEKHTTDHSDHRNHVANFLTCVREGRRNTACPIELGSLCATYTHMGNISARLGGTSLRYDSHKRSFNHTAADAYIQPQYRAPWAFPTV
ncbi:Gfo/Idh/MocA family protein [Parapedobacter sp. 10938]|uniref:Gfo/Idh/MocA family protein n=1 Tax=Parapedobacter flavus TaxID=3110225 RepID=UPI002DBE9A83|nr:Gfo/Idh/MocA family oxidoreductase [Parapedobacter sp. 10938]MEC3879320.1 Gfo/Idh/MocA family oxidoreductase [Parapedobacter sp. 10938]